MNDEDIWTASEPARPRRPPRGRDRVTPEGPWEADAPAVPSTPEPEPNRSPISAGRVLTMVAVFLAGLLVGGAAVLAIPERDAETAPAEQIASADAAAPAASTPETEPSTTIAPTTTTDPGPATTLAPALQGSLAQDLERARALGPLTLPTDCTMPFGVAESLPNGARAYRGGVHQGIDFICGERGRNAVAAMDGQVVMANQSYEDPANDEREQILATAKNLGYTPPWTLAMLFGRVVVLDHGIHPGVGHVVTIYAHLEQIDPAIRPGAHIAAGQRIGEIGNRGTETAATGGDRPQSLHLHWELHIDDHFLAEGGNVHETDQIYRALFGR